LYSPFTPFCLQRYTVKSYFIGSADIFTQTETGTVNSKRPNAVTRMMVVEYGGSEGGNGSPIAKSKNPSERLWRVEFLRDCGAVLWRWMEGRTDARRALQ
jgi:hypothetical protein